MAATGNETIKLNQLKTYIKYISDENLETYLNDEAPSGITGNEAVTLAQVKKYLGSGGSSQQLQAVTLFEGRQIGNPYDGLYVDIGESVTNYEYFEITMRDTLGSGGTGTTRLEVTGPTSTVYENSYTAYGITITATGTSISASRSTYMQYLEMTKIVGYKYT